jgi:hypothetical protein
VIGDWGETTGIKVVVKSGDRWTGGTVVMLRRRPGSPDNSDPCGVEIHFGGGTRFLLTQNCRLAKLNKHICNFFLVY